MATSTVTRRNLPSQTQTASQHTAPVHEFRCLFTHDIFKKTKKWHDGSLRFHTFNRRVMVYDDSKNYIGDLHYRQEEEFDEGLELQLDKGVKVEVGERLGETQTDLAPLLDRRKPEESVRSGNGQTTSPPRARNANAIALAHQRPRSIADVLGATQTRMSRSRFPLQSPFEQRTDHPSRVEPPLKRVKTVAAAEKENEAVQGVQIKPKTLSTVAQHGPIQSIPNPVLRHSSPIEATEILDLSSDDDHVPEVKINQPRKERVQPTSKSTREKSTGSKAIPITQESPQEQRLSRGRGIRSENGIANSASKVIANRQDPRTHRTTLRQIAQAVAPTTTLLLPKPQSRRKLMYKALLLSRGAVKSVNTNTRPLLKLAEIDTDDSDGDTIPNAHMPRAIGDAINVYNDSLERSSEYDIDVSQSEIPELAAHEEPVKRPPTPPGGEIGIALSRPNPLFVSQADKPASPLSVSSQSDDFVVPSHSPSPVKRFSQNIQVPSTPPVPSSPTTSQIQAVQSTPVQFPISRHNPLAPDIDSPSDENRLATVPDVPVTMQLVPEQDPQQTSPALPARLPQPFSARRRPLQRLFSAELGEDATMIARDKSPTKHVMPTALQSLQARARIAATTKISTTSRIGRSKSDTETLVENPDRAEETAANIFETTSRHQPEMDTLQGETTGEKGPWTANEAYLLFNWWPPNRSKPIYGDTSAFPLTQVQAPRQMPLKITTARDLLRDEMG